MSRGNISAIPVLNWLEHDADADINGWPPTTSTLLNGWRHPKCSNYSLRRWVIEAKILKKSVIIYSLFSVKTCLAHSSSSNITSHQSLSKLESTGFYTRVLHFPVCSLNHWGVARQTHKRSKMKNTTRLGIVLGISISFFAAEVTSTSTHPEPSSGHWGIYRLIWFPTLVGFKTKSLALIADAVR